MSLQPWASSVLVLVLAAAAVALEAAASSQEPSVDRCVIVETMVGVRYICNDGDFEIVRESDLLWLNCNDAKLNCSRFPSINVGNNSVVWQMVIARCALDGPISCFLAKMHFTHVNRLYLEELPTPLTARHFEGLEATTNLYIQFRDAPSVQKVNQHDVIPSLPHLQTLTIVAVQLTLGPGPQAPALQSLKLSSDSISELPPGSLEGFPSLTELNLEDNRIADINNDTFAGLDKLRYLNLNGNRISVLRGGALSPLRRLENLKIKNNPIKRVHYGLLQGLDYLEYVDISSAEQMVLDPRAFADLRSLHYLNLEECGIQELPSTVFQGSKFIQTLSLSNNQLESLHPELFRDQTEMIQIELKGNNLTVIPDDLFRNLMKLVRLDISYNQFENFPDGLFSPLTSLKYLLASHNKLKKINPIALPQLRFLDLAHNSIARIPHPNFLLTDNVTVATVDLSYNNISTVVLDPESFALQTTPAKFILDHNPLNCDCQIYSFAKFATTSNYFSLHSAQCNAPVRLKGANLNQIPLDEFKCQPKCPSVCNCTPYVGNYDIVEAVCSEDSTEPSHLTNAVSLKFTRQPKSLRHRSFNNVVEIDLSGLHLNEIDLETLPGTVKFLNLSDNNLKYLPKDVLKGNISFALSNNPLFCDCWNREHVDELQQNRANILDYLALKCEDDSLLMQVDVQRICDIWIATIIGISLIILAVVCLLFALIIYRYPFEVKICVSKYFPCLFSEEKYDASKKFDVFISYAHQDEDFVGDTLLPKLEGPSFNLKTCIHSRDWIVGEMIPYNIAKSVEESRRTLIVLSENFLKSIWGLLEFRAAHVQAAREGRMRVVVILIEDVTNREDLDEEIKAYLHTNTYIKWGEPWFWEKLAYALPKRAKIVDREEKRLQSIANQLALTRLDVQLNNDD